MIGWNDKMSTAPNLPTLHVHCTCGADMIPGPRGGAAQNFYCTDRVRCRLGWNLTIYYGEIVMGHPIEVDEEAYRMYAAQHKNLTN